MQVTRAMLLYNSRLADDKQSVQYWMRPDPQGVTAEGGTGLPPNEGGSEYQLTTALTDVAAILPLGTTVYVTVSDAAPAGSSSASGGSNSGI